MNHFYAKPEPPPPVSEWRRNILRICAEDRALRRAAHPHVAPRCSVPAQPKPKPRPRVPRVPKLKILCACGRRIGKPDELNCSWCRQHPCSTAAARTCTFKDCRAKIIRTNTSGLCKKHGDRQSRKLREIRTRGPRPTCSYQADGMRCAQRLYRDNTVGLCCFHSGRQMGSEYRNRKPAMVPLEQAG